MNRLLQIICNNNRQINYLFIPSCSIKYNLFSIYFTLCHFIFYYLTHNCYFYYHIHFLLFFKFYYTFQNFYSYWCSLLLIGHKSKFEILIRLVFQDISEIFYFSNFQNHQKYSEQVGKLEGRQLRNCWRIRIGLERQGEIKLQKEACRPRFYNNNSQITATMENKVKRFLLKQDDSMEKNQGNAQQPTSCLKTPRMRNQLKTVFQNLKVSQSTIVLADNGRTNDCSKCKIHEQKLRKLRIVQEEVSYLRQRNCQIKQQIQLLCNNFMYILELASENIIKGAKSKVKKIVSTKQNLIQKQTQIIKRLENQSELLIDKVDAGMESSQKIFELEEKIKLLEAENSQLRAATSRKCEIGDDFNSFLKSSTDICTLQSGDKSPKQNLNRNFQFGSVTLNSLCNPETSTRKIRKQKTLEIDSFDPILEESNQMKSIKSLKMKINIIKEKLINQKL